MASVNERLAKLETSMDENQKTVWRLFEAIYGNGKPGLIADVKSLSEKVDDIKKEIVGVSDLKEKLSRTNQSLALLNQSVQNHHQSVEDLQKRSRANWQWVVTIIVAILGIVVAIFK